MLINNSISQCCDGRDSCSLAQKPDFYYLKMIF